jgi:hypothetical protein
LFMALGVDFGVVEADPDGFVEVEAFAGVRRGDGGGGDGGVVAAGDGVGSGGGQWGAVGYRGAVAEGERERGAGGRDGDAFVVDEGVVPAAQADEVVDLRFAAEGPELDVVQVGAAGLAQSA